MTDHQYLNILANSFIDDETRVSLEHRDLIKCDKHKKTWLKSFANDMGRLSQGLGDIVKVADTISFLEHEKYQ